MKGLAEKINRQSSLFLFFNVFCVRLFWESAKPYSALNISLMPAIEPIMLVASKGR